MPDITSNWVGSTQVDPGDVQHTGIHRFNGGSSFIIVDPTDATKSVIFNLSGLPTGTQTEFTIPDSDSSLVTLTAAQSLTNKGLDDTTTTFFDTASPTKLGRFELSGVTAGQTRVMTWPNFDGTLATLAGTETFTNKTFSDSTCTFADNGDLTKKAAFECSGITTATTRTLTIPNSSGTIAYLDGSTFTNAVLTAPTINAATLTGNITGGTVAPTTLTVPSGTALAAPTVTVSLLITSTTGALGVPVMSEAQRDALTPAAGWVIYNTDDAKLNVYTTAWETIVSA